MSKSSSNLPEIEKMLHGLAACLDFTKGFGKDALSFVATRISDRSRQQEGPDTYWEENRGKYGEKKRAKGLPVGKGLKDRGSPTMLSLVQLQGEQAVTEHEATLTYGIDEETREIAGYFTEGRGSVQPARPFYEITSEDEAELLGLAEDAVDRFLREV